MNILMYDFGVSIEHALRLADNGKNKVKYFSDWPSGSPVFTDYAPGLGFEKEGVEKIMYFADHIKEADLICFFSSGAGDWAEYLRKTTGIPIFGAGKGERLENHRLIMRHMQKEKLGLPTQKTTSIKGVTALRAYLKANKDKIVKIDIFRGDLETLAVKKYEQVKIPLDKLEFDLGGFADSFEFMVEEFIDGVETGFNVFFNGKEFIKPYMWTFLTESGSSSFGKFVDGLPESLQKIADAFLPILRRMDYRGLICIEARVTKEKVAYLTDVTGRFSYPESLVFLESIKNFPEVIYKVAKGEEVKLDTAGQYFLETHLESQEAKESWLKVDIDLKYQKYIKPYVAAKNNGELYAVKGTTVVAAITVGGEDVDKLVKQTELLSQKVDCYKIDKSNIETLADAKKDIDSYNGKYGWEKF